MKALSLTKTTNVNPVNPVKQNNQKTLAGHLLAAGLISSSQLKLAICEYQLTRKPLSEIVIDRGWVKDYILEDLANRLMGVSFKSVRQRQYQPTFELCAA